MRPFLFAVRAFVVRYQLLLAIVAGVLVLLWLANVLTPDPSDDPVVKRAVAGFDSLRMTRAPDSLARAELARVETVTVAKANIVYRASLTAQREAESARALADSLAIVAATATDSAAAWHRAYDARTIEAAASLARGDSLDRAFHLERDARLLADSSNVLLRMRLGASERVNGDLREAVDIVSKCRFAKYIPCPSRTVAAVAGAVGGGLLMVRAIQ